MASRGGTLHHTSSLSAPHAALPVLTTCCPSHPPLLHHGCTATPPPQGGEAAALARLKYYLWDSNLIFEYFNIRNGMLGGDYSTKLAPWLAAGNISPRTIYHEVGGDQGGVFGLMLRVTST